MSIFTSSLTAFTSQPRAPCAAGCTFRAAGRTLRVCHMQQGICFHSEKLGRTALTDIFTAGLAGSIYRSTVWIKRWLSVTVKLRSGLCAGEQD